MAHSLDPAHQALSSSLWHLPTHCALPALPPMRMGVRHPCVHRPNIPYCTSLPPCEWKGPAQTAVASTSSCSCHFCRLPHVPLTHSLWAGSREVAGLGLQLDGSGSMGLRLAAGQSPCPGGRWQHGAQADNVWV